MGKKRKAKHFPRFLSSLGVAGAAVLLLVSFSLRQNTTSWPPLPQSVDVVVVGSGVAGAVAALTAAQAGSDVFYLDLTGPFGTGFPAFSPAFWAAGTPPQQDLMPAYTSEVMTQDVFSRGGGAGNESQIYSLSHTSAESLAWLEEQSGVAFSVLANPSENPGLHLPALGEAQTFLPASLEAALSPLLAGFSDTWRLKELLLTPAGIAGVVAILPDGREIEIRSRAVVLADGGMAANLALLQQYTGTTGVVPRPEGGHSGTGFLLAQAAGARIRDINAVTLLTVFLPQGRRFLPEMHPGAVRLDAAGERIPTGEEAVLKSQEGPVYIVLGEGQRENIPDFIAVDDMLTLASRLGVSAEKLAASLHGLPAPYRVATLGTIALTPGGLEVDEQYRVLGPEGPLPGLYAAGELTAGVHGREAIPDLVLADEIISGRLAGAAAASYARR
ncbi:MAG: FAD-binding protein [Dethiobacter sp.]|nr:FAD-binding protein [Dethiobacter sp.]